jgi:D-sedoheptulose 7-phosphate isomerase|tara:strand:+ start:6106 stop:6690 length:585 start_codon:yes stop_codon:yes gene_type:complete
MNKEKIHEYIDEQIKSTSCLKENYEVFENIFNVLKNARDTGKQVFVMGNGGSASTASHFVADLLKTSITQENKRFKAISLSDNIPVLLAWSNDESYDNIFSNQLENFLDKDDVVIGISGSGNSKNVLNAIQLANEKHATTIGLNGKGGGKLSEMVKINLTVNNEDMLTIETIHLLICHLLTTMIRSDGTPKFNY